MVIWLPYDTRGKVRNRTPFGDHALSPQKRAYFNSTRIGSVILKSALGWPLVDD